MSDFRSPREGSAPAGPGERFTLKVPPRFGPRFFITLAMTLGLVIVLFARPMLASGDVTALLMLLAMAALVPGVFALSTAGREEQPVSIEVLTDRVYLPTTGPARLAVYYRNIRALFLQRRGLGGFLYIATDERELVFPLQAFPDDGAERLVRTIRDRMSSSGADGVRRLAAIDRMSRVAERAFSRTPVVTWAAVAIMAAIHVFLVATERLVGVLDVASLGAVSPELVEAAGPYLATTAHWVHGWRFQPLLVLPGVLILGTMVERLHGHGAVALSMLGSATLGGIVAAYYPGSPLHAGALIPAAGLIGTLAFTAQRYRGRMPIGFRLNGQWWAWLVMLTALAITVHGLSVPGVLFGLLTGVVVAAVITDDDPELPLPYSPRWTAAVAGVLAAIHLGGAVWALEDLRGKALTLERIAVENLQQPNRLNEYAWYLAAYDENASQERLELALTAAQRAGGLERSGLNRSAIKDTEATVLHRLGRHPEAIGLEREVLEDQPDYPSSATQLGRFILAALEKGPIEVNAVPVEGLAVELVREPTEPPPSGGPSPTRLVAKVTLEAPLAEPYILYAPVQTEGQLAGLLRLGLPMTETSSSTAVVLVKAASDLLEAEGPLEVVPAYTVEGKASAKMWPAHPAFLKYP